jgi:poly(ADP-ribose) glycohydrolase ARH3
MNPSAVEEMRAAGWAALDREEVRDRIRGALLGGACGDGVGAVFESQTRVDPGQLERHLHGVAPLVHTDDTVTTLVLAQHLAARALRGGDLDEELLVQELAWAWRKEPWRGYGAGSEQVFRAVLLGVPWLRAASGLFGGTGSFGNGAAMRVAPIALVGKPLGSVLDLARRSSRLTHLHPIGEGGAALQATAVALAVSGDRDRPLDPERFLRAVLAFPGHPAFTARLHRLRCVLGDERPARAVRSLGNGVPALESVPAAVLAFLRSPDDPQQVLEFAVRLGGDTDSIAAMAGTLAGARCGGSRLPAHLVTRLENGPHIVDVADAVARCADAGAPASVA